MLQAERNTDTAEDGAVPGGSRRPVSPLTVLGVILLLAGLVCLGWLGWQYFGTNVVSKQEAGKQMTALEQTWGDTNTQADPLPITDSDVGEAQWLIRIPALGDDWVWPVVVGVGDEDLKKGVGWYPTTSQPGQVGNFALAGHRVTNGEPFRRILELQVGDEVLIETKDSFLTYELTSSPAQLTVQDTETWVLDPVPGHEEAQPTEPLITLTTCEDLVRSPDRSVAFGKLISEEAK